MQDETNDDGRQFLAENFKPVTDYSIKNFKPTPGTADPMAKPSVSGSSMAGKPTADPSGQSETSKTEGATGKSG